MTEKKLTAITAVADVTQEVLDAAYTVMDGWPSGRPIDVENMLDRIEAAPLDDGTYPDLGVDVASPAVREILRAAQQYKREDL